MNAPRAAVVAAALLTTGLALWWISDGAGSTAALVRLQPDDAYYYFLTAQHIRVDGMSAFDGSAPTNGYHPLWMACCVLFALTPVRAMLLGWLLTLAAASYLWRLLRQWMAPPAAAAGVALFLLNARIIMNALNGLETAMHTLLFVAAVLAVWRAAGQPSRGRAAAAGIAIALLWLSRTDAAFYCLALLAWFCWQAPALRARVVALGAGLLPLPLLWLGWNLHAFGSIVQTSGSAIPFVLREGGLLAATPGAEWRYGIGKLAAWLTDGVGFATGWPPVFFWVSLGGALVLLARSGDALRPLRRLLVLLWGAAALLVLVHTLVRWHPTHWYFPSLIVLHLLTLTLALRRVPPAAARLLPLLLVVLLLWQGVQLYAWRAGDYPWQTELLGAAQWLRVHTPPDAIVGAFDSGILGWYSGRTVVNLDGVINNEAATAIRARSLFAYMRQRKVQWYADHDPYMRQLFAPFGGDPCGMTYREMAVIDHPGVALNGCPVKVFALTWPQ